CRVVTCRRLEISTIGYPLPVPCGHLYSSTVERTAVFAPAPSNSILPALQACNSSFPAQMLPGNIPLNRGQIFACAVRLELSVVCSSRSYKRHFESTMRTTFIGFTHR